MEGNIFLVREDGNLEEMTQQRYEKEDILQKYLEDYPNLLPGDQIDQTSPRRWLLISRAGIILSSVLPSQAKKDVYSLRIDAVTRK